MRWLALGTCTLAVAFASTSFAQVTERISLRSDGGQSLGGGILSPPVAPVISEDGRYVLFTTASNDIVPGDTNGTFDVFARDRLAGTTERVSLATGGAEANDFSGLLGASISDSGRFVAFESRASNLVHADTNFARDIFVRDRLAGVTQRVSVSSSGSEGNGTSVRPWISVDGRFVAFSSEASNLVPGDTNGASDIFVRDRQSGTTDLISKGLSGGSGNGGSYQASISADGRYVAFESLATDLVSGDTNARADAFVRDRLLASTERVSVSTGGAQANNQSISLGISNDGRYVVFTSEASNLVAGDTNGTDDIFLRDRDAGTTSRVSVAADGSQGNMPANLAFISGDGRSVAFQSGSDNLVPGDSAFGDVFVRDLALGTVERVSVTTAGMQANGQSDSPCISRDGRFVAFRSYATNFVPGDTNANVDVFLHDRRASSFTSLCDPGLAGVAPCPCGNPPGGRGRGCDNSFSTGGAILSASGIAYLSTDTLTFTAIQAPPSTLSILVQGSVLSSGGTLYGQGVRCAGGALERLFVTTSVSGTVLAPDFTAGDPTVSARSASRGDVIGPGQSRWYFVYYRDPGVLGGCSPLHTFNATQTGHITWWP